MMIVDDRLCSQRSGLSVVLLPVLLMIVGAPGRAAEVERDADEAASAATLDITDREGQAYVPSRPAKMPDLTKGDSLPKSSVVWNMGPVGIVGVKNGGNAGDQVQVVSVIPGSPAEGKLLPGDVVLGVGGEDFVIGGDINRVAGNAIIRAEEEAGKGLLDIRIWRDRNWIKRNSEDVFGIDIGELFKEVEADSDLYAWQDDAHRVKAVRQMGFDKYPMDGVSTNITVQLEVMGTYSSTSPWNCPVVKKVRERAWRVIAARFEPDKKGVIHGDWRGALALVASGKPEYIALVKRWVHTLDLETDMNAKLKNSDMHTPYLTSWYVGYVPLSMAIYYDATGDDYVLPEIRLWALYTAIGQSGGGAWGHGFAVYPGGPCSGYGAMNNSGTRCFFLLTLAKKFGIDHPEIDAAIARSSRFFRTYVDKGAIPYGYHPPANTDSNNGKNYGAAYAFYVLGKTYEAKYLAMNSAHASFTRRGGHGSPIFWYYTPLSANIVGPRAVMTSQRNMRYFYTLSRRHDGSFILLGEQTPGIGGHGQRNPTATVALHLSAPLKQLVITGKDAKKDYWLTDEELNELLVSARGTDKHGQIKDPLLLEAIGKPWNERGSDELIDMLDHFYPNMRRDIAAELGKRYAAGEKELVAKLLPKLGSEEARMRAGACLALSACSQDAVLRNLSKLVAMLEDDAEFVRMAAAGAIGAATKPGDPQREVAFLEAASEDYPGMTMDNGNLMRTIQAVLLPRSNRDFSYSDGSLLTDPFKAGYDNSVVRAALERLVTMDPDGFVPATWSRDTLVRLAGPILFAASERQMNGNMTVNIRLESARALLFKFRYREAAEGDADSIVRRNKLERSVRRRTGCKGPTVERVKAAPEMYHHLLDEFYLLQLDSPIYQVKYGRVNMPLSKLIEMIEQAGQSKQQQSLMEDAEKVFQSELARAGDEAAQLDLCRKTLDDVEGKDYYRKMGAMSHLSRKLGAEAFDNVCPFLRHHNWRLRKHAEKVATDLVRQGAGPRLVDLFEAVQAGEGGGLGGSSPAGMLAVLADAGYRPALDVAKAALDNSDSRVRKAAIQCVHALGGSAEIKTVFAFMERAKTRQDYHGCELALLARRDDPAHVKRVSQEARTLLFSSKQDMRRSLAWVLGQCGGPENLAAIQQAAESPLDEADLREMVLALAYSPDRAADQAMLALAKNGNDHLAIVATLSVHRMVGRHGASEVPNDAKIAFARAILDMQYNDPLIKYLGQMHSVPATQLLFEVMKKGRGSTAVAAEAIVHSVSDMKNLSDAEAEMAADIMTEVIEYIEVTKLRGGIAAHAGSNYPRWKRIQALAGNALLKVHKPKKPAVPDFSDMDMDL